MDPDPIHIRDGSSATAAGVTSALDPTLSFIEEDRGVPLARQVARNLVTYLQRPGNQAQMSLFTGVSGEGNDVVQAAIGFITTPLDADLSTAAGHVGVGPRHLTRLFDMHLGRPPARFVRQARTGAAARLPECSALSVSAIAARCGFPTAEALRQNFVSQYALSSTPYRARFTRPSSSVPAPS